MSTVKETPTEPEEGKEPDKTEPTNQSQNNNDGDGKDPVPYDRFQTVNQQKNDALARLEELEKAEAERSKKAKEAEEERLKKQQEFETLAEQYKAERDEKETAVTELQDRIEKYEGVLTSLYEARKTAVPEMYQPLLEKLDLIERLEWIAGNEDKLKTSNGSNGIPPTPTAKGVGSISDEERRKKAARVW